MKRRLNIFEFLGIVLVVLSVALFLASRVYFEKASNSALSTVTKIESLLPPASAGLMDEDIDPEMPALQVKGQDYVAILDFPGYGVTLPVANEWSALGVFASPCRFFGSVYDGTMIIGGSDQPGQLDFFPRMELGDTVRVTDMMGAEFSYTVQRIDRAKSADYEKLASGGYYLTLFVRGSYSMDYILVRCIME